MPHPKNGYSTFANSPVKSDRVGGFSELIARRIPKSNVRHWIEFIPKHYVTADKIPVPVNHHPLCGSHVAALNCGHILGILLRSHRRLSLRLSGALASLEQGERGGHGLLDGAALLDTLASDKLRNISEHLG